MATSNRWDIPIGGPPATTVSSRLEESFEAQGEGIEITRERLRRQGVVADLELDEAVQAWLLDRPCDGPAPLRPTR